MPAELERCVKKVMAEGKTKEQAYAICNASMKKESTVESLFEIVQSGSIAVDREAGIIRGVRILGPVSANGRKYVPSAISGALAMYEGRPVNANHPPRSAPDSDRQVQDRIGWLSGVKLTDGGLSGDLNILTGHPLASAVLEAADRNPALFGLSHNAEGRTRRENGSTLVEEIVRVRSVDLVSDPASTKSLFESEYKPMKKTIKSILESVFAEKEPQLVILREIDEAMPDAMSAEAEIAPEADAGEQMATAFRSMVMTALDDTTLDVTAKAGRIKEILKAQEKLMGTKEEKSEEKPEEKPTAESIQIKAMNADLVSLREQIEQLKKLPADRIQSGIPATPKPEGKVAENAEQFFESVTGRKPPKQ